MNRTVQVVALVGSLRDDSKTRIACREALDAAAAAGADTRLIDLREFTLPPFDGDARDAGEADRLRRIVAGADAILLGTPNYHGSYAGVLKNALDYLGRDELAGKTVGLLEVAGGSFPTPALMHLRQVCRTLNAWTLPHQVGVPNSGSTVTADGIGDDRITERTRRLGRELVAYAGVDDYPDLAERRPSAPVGD